VSVLDDESEEPSVAVVVVSSVAPDAVAVLELVELEDCAATTAVTDPVVALACPAVVAASAATEPVVSTAATAVTWVIFTTRRRAAFRSWVRDVEGMHSIQGGRPKIAVCGTEELRKVRPMRSINVLAPAASLVGTQIGARVFELAQGQHSHPYHFHHGIEQWLVVLAGAPVLRTPGGEQVLRKGDTVCFPVGCAGAHQVHGRGTVLILSELRELDLVEYPESGMAELRPSGRTFRAGEPATAAPVHATRVVNLHEVGLETDERMPPGFGRRIAECREALGAARLGATVYEVDPGDRHCPYHYEGVEEEFVLVLAGSPTLRAEDGEHVLAVGDLVCFPPGPAGGHQLANRSEDVVRFAMLSTQPPGGLSICIYPDSAKVGVWPWPAQRLSIGEPLDYWAGES
jgi:uncharacterized cupin superfamily protein